MSNEPQEPQQQPPADPTPESPACADSSGIPASVLRACIDHPQDWENLPDPFELHGWIYNENGPDFAAVRVTLGDRTPVVIESGLLRPDLAAALPAVPAAARSGFRARGLRPPPGRFDITLEALDAEGAWRIFAVRPGFHPRPPGPPLRFCVDHPQNWENLPERIEFLGWIFAETGPAVREVRVRIGASAPITIEHGRERPEIGASFPGVPAAARCGFFGAEIPLRPRAQTLTAEAVLEDGSVHAFFSREARMSLDPQAVPGRSYQDWIRLHDTPGAAERHAARSRTARPGPLFSIILPVHNPPPRALDRAFASVAAQLYGRWELCVADDASTDPAVAEVIRRWEVSDPRIRVVRRPVNGHISEASNSALALATGTHVAFLDHDDELAPHALSEIVAALDRFPEAEIVYSDEDKIDEDGRRYSPQFKPAWSPDLILTQNYLCHLSVYRIETVRAVGGLRKGFEGSQDWDLALRVIERTTPDRIVHVPHILYHWRAIPGSTALSLTEKSYAVVAGERAIREHLQRTGNPAEVTMSAPGTWRLVHPLPDPAPRVSLVIPTRDRVDLMVPLLRSLAEHTDYPRERTELVIVDHASSEPATARMMERLRSEGATVVREEGAFNFSRLVNSGVRAASGEFVVLLNDDVEAAEPGWLRELVSQAAREGVGASGALLVQEDGTLQHAGIVLGLGGEGGAANAFQGLRPGDGSQAYRQRQILNYSAVTGACLCTRRAAWLAAGGFDESLPVAYNDVDFCLKLLRRGLRIVWTPFARLVHHESVSRGGDLSGPGRERAAAEAAELSRRWTALIDDDPAYHPSLTLKSADYSLAFPPRPRLARLAAWTRP